MGVPRFILALVRERGERSSRAGVPREWCPYYDGCHIVYWKSFRTAWMEGWKRANESKMGKHSRTHICSDS